MSLEEETRSYFARNYNCAQSVFAPLAEKLGFDVKTALKLATPFGGGISHTGHICGALSGALMAIGLAKGVAGSDRECTYACYALGEELLNRFIELHGDLTCHGLLGLDISDPTGSAQAYEENIFTTLCPIFVSDAVRIAGEILELQE